MVRLLDNLNTFKLLEANDWVKMEVASKGDRSVGKGICGLESDFIL